MATLLAKAIKPAQEHLTSSLLPVSTYALLRTPQGRQLALRTVRDIGQA